ncbi:MAG: UDP-3-O-(3-hydroxymyristoyl)glucosamine N-acyltransferase [Planctomycetota bacterium]
MKLGDIAKTINAELIGDAGVEISGVASLSDATSGTLSYLGDRKLLKALASSAAEAVVIERDLRDSSFAKGKHLLLVDDPNEAFITASALFAPPSPSYEPGRHPSAVVHEEARVHPSAHIGANCVVCKGASVGEGTVLVAGVFIGENAKVGANCLIYANAVVREYCVIGDRCILHPCAVIGADGFGFRTVNGRHRKIPQTGIVVLEDDVEVGACSCVDRARFARTVVGQGTKIDNLVQIAHNVSVGKHCLIASQVGIAGTSRLGDYVIFAGQSGMGDHLSVGKGTIVLARAGVTKDIPDGLIVSGFPAIEHSEELKRQVHARKIPGLDLRIKQLEERIRQLEAKTENDCR